MKNIRVERLRFAVACMQRADLDELSVDELDRIESDLGVWAGLAMVAAMTKRAKARLMSEEYHREPR